MTLNRWLLVSVVLLAIGSLLLVLKVVVLLGFVLFLAAFVVLFAVISLKRRATVGYGVFGPSPPQVSSEGPSAVLGNEDHPPSDIPRGPGASP